MSKPTRFAHWKWLRVDPKWQQIRRAEDKHMGWVREAGDVSIKVVVESADIKIDLKDFRLCSKNCQWLDLGGGEYSVSCKLFDTLLKVEEEGIYRSEECLAARKKLEELCVG